MDSILLSNIMSDFSDVWFSVIWAVVTVCVIVYFNLESGEFKNVIIGALIIIITTGLLSGISTVFNLPAIRVKTNVQRVKLECFKIEDVKDVNIILRRLEGAESLK